MFVHIYLPTGFSLSKNWFCPKIDFSTWNVPWVVPRGRNWKPVQICLSLCERNWPRALVNWLSLVTLRFVFIYSADIQAEKTGKNPSRFPVVGGRPICGLFCFFLQFTYSLTFFVQRPSRQGARLFHMGALSTARRVYQQPAALSEKWGRRHHHRRNGQSVGFMYRLERRTGTRKKRTGFRESSDSSTMKGTENDCAPRAWEITWSKNSN